MSKMRLTDSQKTTIQQAAMRVWEEIGYDSLTAVMEESGGKKDTMPRSHVLELVCDAGRLEDRLRSMQRSGDLTVTSELLDWVEHASMAQLTRVLKPHFPFTRYGM